MANEFKFKESSNNILNTKENESKNTFEEEIESENTFEEEIENENTKADKATREKRKEIITEFLTTYKTKKYDNSDIPSKLLKKIKKNGITINQLYEIMCASVPDTKAKIPQPSKTITNGLLGESLTLPNFKKLVKNLGYTWDNPDKLVLSLETGSLVDSAKLLYTLLVENPCEAYIHASSNTINSKLKKGIAEDTLHDLYTITISFENSKHIASIAELLDTLYRDKCLGVIPGIRIIEIRCLFPVKTKNIYRSLLSIINSGIYNGYHLFK